MVAATIGGESIQVDFPNFRALKRGWRYINGVSKVSDPMESVSAILSLIACGEVGRPCDPDPEAEAARIAARVDEFEDVLRPQELGGLRPFVNELLVFLGMAAPAGEDTPAGETTPSPSMETLTA